MYCVIITNMAVQYPRDKSALNAINLRFYVLLREHMTWICLSAELILSKNAFA